MLAKANAGLRLRVELVIIPFRALRALGHRYMVTRKPVGLAGGACVASHKSKQQSLCAWGRVTSLSLSFPVVPALEPCSEAYAYACLSDGKDISE